MSPGHLDDFTLLRYAALDLDGAERGEAEEHLRGCAQCAHVLGSLEKLDVEMKTLAKDFAQEAGFASGDPFAARPEEPRHSRGRAPRLQNLAEIALEASERAGDESGRILEAARRPQSELASSLSDLSLADLGIRFGLLYALQEAGREIAESPLRALGLGLAAVGRLAKEHAGDAPEATERIVPLEMVAAQAHLLAAQGRTWTGELEKAKGHFEQAYRLFGRSTGDEASLAMVELGEAQRRAFAGDSLTGLALARRCRMSFTDMGLEDFVARACVAEGICLSKLGREAEALAAFQSAIPVFQQRELWSNYVGAVNAVGACLGRTGRLDEARREYARVLKSISREKHAAWVGYVRNGLAMVLFEAGSYREAALAFVQTSRVFRDLGLVAHTLTASLFEIESWARAGDLGRASHRLEIFRAEVARHDALDQAIVRRLEEALSGSDPDLAKVAKLRQSAGQMMRERLERMSG